MELLLNPKNKTYYEKKTEILLQCQPKQIYKNDTKKI